MQQTQAVIVKGQPWALPADLSEADITRRLNTDDWDYALPSHESDRSTLTIATTPLMEASEERNGNATDRQNSRHEPL